MNDAKHNEKSQKNKKLIFKTHYSSFGWLLYSIGMSAKPVKVDFLDPDTNELVSSTTDPEILKKYVGR
ncbi:MAG: hypothetical protein KJ571_07810 [Bacteroidetes bacterium]|nr:hypothetical protein [Bacteroidota bacterium]